MSEAARLPAPATGPGAGMSTGMGTGYDAVLDGLAGWLERAARVFPAVARDRERLEEQLAQVKGVGARVEAPLVMLIAGGTGAGKSTLLNALAGAEIAKASPVRPTTTALTCYHHAANELLIPPGIAAAARRAAHERPELRDKIVVDAPDFDSSARENEAALRRALAEADLVLCVATPEKYADADLYALLEEHRAGRAFVFVLNRLDRGIDPEVVADFRAELERAGFARPRLLVLSALAAWRRRTSAAEDGPEGDFPELEAIIARELTRARIRELKRLNLDALVVRLVDRFVARLPADLPGRVARWRRGGERLCAEASAALAERLAAAVREDDGLRHEVAARLATRYGGPFGFYQAVVWGVRGLRGAGLSMDGGFRLQASGYGWQEAAISSDPDRPGVPLPGAPPEAPFDGAQGKFRLEPGASGAPTADAQAVHLAARRLSDLGAELGLGEAALPLDAAAAGRLVQSARLEADRAIASTLRTLRLESQAARAAKGSGGRRGVESALLNAPPLATLGYALWRWLAAFADGRILDVSWFVAAGLVTVAVLALEGALVDALSRRRAGRLVARLEEAAATAADDRVARPLLSRLEASLGEIEGVVGEVDALRDAANRAAGHPAAARAAGRYEPSLPSQLMSS